MARTPSLPDSTPQYHTVLRAKLLTCVLLLLCTFCFFLWSVLTISVMENRITRLARELSG